MGTRLAALLMVLVLAACGSARVPNSERIVDGVMTEEYTLDAPRLENQDRDLRLFIRNKHPAKFHNPTPQRTVLFVHGASYPAHSSFDLPFDGASWMDLLAKAGYDVYTLDIRGYGRSSRPKAMGQPAEANPPAVDTATATADLSKAVDFILSRRNLEQLTLVGWSWGATLAAKYTTSASNRVEKLVLYAPQWLRDGPPPPPDLDPNTIGAWRLVNPADARARWLSGVPAAQHDTVLPQAAFEAWMSATLDSDPQAREHTPPAVRAPNGVVADTLRGWAMGVPLWDPTRLWTPTMVVQGEWDMEAPLASTKALFDLIRAPNKRYVLIPQATHAALIESNRARLFDEVQRFLEDRKPGP